MDRRTLLKTTAAAVTATLLPNAEPAPTRVLTLGDSITAAGLWQAEFDRLCALAGWPVSVYNVGVPGARTTHWPSVVGALLDEYQPDLVTFFTGTNDDVNELAYGEPATSWAWRATVEAIRAHRTPPIKICPGFIQYSDPLIAPQWLLDAEPITNDRIYVAWSLYQAAGWFTGLADFQRIPGTASFLDGGGIHPTPRGYRYMGRIVYDAVRVSMGWPECGEPALCDMYGHRRGYPRPFYTPCQS